MTQAGWRIWTVRIVAVVLLALLLLDRLGTFLTGFAIPFIMGAILYELRLLPRKGTEK
jgi:hypothetical protein